MTEHKKNNINLFIFIFGLIIFFTKWYHPYVNFNEEGEVKIIFESVSDGYIYFANFKALANLDLNNSFNPLIKNLGTITIPTGAFTLHFIFYSNFIFLLNPKNQNRYNLVYNMDKMVKYYGARRLPHPHGPSW